MLACENASVSSGDDVRRLHREGLSIGAIAARLELSRMRVHRTLAALVESDSTNGDATTTVAH